MSRSSAKQSITNKMLRQALAANDVNLIGGGLDEAPMAYKDITRVMGYQNELVDVLGVFTPKIVRMCGDDSPAED
jgi:tRNA-splicing ligase RtcB (3'-phosphate/5'-hydroxy nucleic acid ligase)